MHPSQPKPSRVTFHRLAVATLGTTLILIAVGGAVRATDSGLACPTWPGCFAPGDFVPGWQWNVWLEHTHRLLAGIAGLQVAALFVWSLARYRRYHAIVWTSATALVAVMVQAALGAVVVLRLLQAELVTAHLGMAMVVLACLGYLVVNVRTLDEPRPPARDLRLAHAVSAVAAIALAQILVGGHVTGIHAGLVFTDFPLMGGQVLPPITTEREAFHVAHRVLAFVLLGGVGWLCARAVRYRRELQAAGAWDDSAHRWLVRLPMWAATLTVIQIGLGVANLWTRSSEWTVIPHLAVASWIWTVLVFCALLAYRRAPGVELARGPEDAAQVRA